MVRWYSAALLAVLVVLPVQAHFVFIVPQKEAGKVQVVFSDTLEPDDNVPITKIAATKLALRNADGSAQPVEWQKGEGNAYLVSLPKSGSQVAGGITQYGVVQKAQGEPFRLTYHAKAIVGAQPAGLPKAASEPWKHLDLDITVRFALTKGQKLQGQVHWQGQPLASSEVVVMLPGAAENLKLLSDREGRFGCDLPKTGGLIAIRARHVEAKAGEFGGKNYKETRNYATLVVPFQLASAGAVQPGTAPGSSLVVAEEKKVQRKEDVAATRLLREARQARATWGSFPGFSADIEVNHNGKVLGGTAEVSGKGVVAVTLADKDLRDWTRRQLSSLVGHRLGSAADQDTPCTFADDNVHHPLGRAVNVLSDELHSSYRIRNRQIIEVNRTMKDTRFTITVLENVETLEKTFLPTSYVVNTWNVKSGALVSSSAHHNQWRRVGQFDLPTQVMVFQAKGQAPTAGTGASRPASAEVSSALDARTIRFSNLRLHQQ